MTVDNGALGHLTRLKTNREASRGGGGSSGFGGGDEPPHLPDMEARVARLEASLARIESTLAGMSAHMRYLATTESVQAVRTEIATLTGKLDGKATATDLAELRGRAGRIPTMPVLAGLLAIATAIVTTWPWIVSHPHL